MIYLRGPCVVTGISYDFLWRLAEYIVYSSSTLVQLVETPGASHESKTTREDVLCLVLWSSMKPLPLLTP
jgi:hypothetical protein